MTSYDKFEQLKELGFDEYDFYTEVKQWLALSTLNEFLKDYCTNWEVETTDFIDDKDLWDELTHWLDEYRLLEFADDFERLYT